MPTPVLTAALFERFESQGAALFARQAPQRHAQGVRRARREEVTPTRAERARRGVRRPRSLIWPGRVGVVALPRLLSRGPGVDGRQRVRSPQVVGERRSDRGDGRVGGGTRRPLTRPHARRRVARRPRRDRAASTPTRCGSGGPAGPAGWPSGRRPHAAGRRRRRDCRATWTSCAPATRPSPSARSAGRTGAPAAGPAPPRRSSRGAGRPGRVPPPWTSMVMPRWSRAIAAHSMCQPGRPWPRGVSHAGSSGRADCQTRQSSGSSLPGRAGSPPRSAKIASIVGVVQTGDRSEGGVVADTEVQVRVDRVDRTHRLQVLDVPRDGRDRLDGADVVLRRQHVQRCHVLAEQRRLALGDGPPVLAGLRPPARAAGRRCR